MNSYDAFLKIIETGSFTAAAKQLGYTQSAVSQIVQALEYELDTQLVVRSRKGITLTPDGEQFLPYIKNICYAEQELHKKQREMKGLEKGIVTIGALSSIACNVLPKLIKSFKQHFPAVQFEIRQGEYTDITNWIIEGSVDFGFINDASSEQLTTHLLLEDPLLAVLSPNDALAHFETLPLTSLADEPFILIDEGESNDALALFEASQLEAHIHYIVEEDYAAMALIEQQLGIAIMPKLMLDRCPYRITTRPLDPPAKRTLYLAYKDVKILPIASRTFIDHILKNISLA
ncbi:LysR family transcriptional regulator [Kurthia massiliensis]|uniref:LysR family transcriptional regulator n=1 Tax=Kurthia massiliensis TaxID=1033739 RepID=UPI0002897891|nr:LysR family transcriptional regulator [Kurthia massiliensis]